MGINNSTPTPHPPTPSSPKHGCTVGMPPSLLQHPQQTGSLPGPPPSLHAPPHGSQVPASRLLLALIPPHCSITPCSSLLTTRRPCCNNLGHICNHSSAPVPSCEPKRPRFPLFNRASRLLMQPPLVFCSWLASLSQLEERWRSPLVTSACKTHLDGHSPLHRGPFLQLAPKSFGAKGGDVGTGLQPQQWEWEAGLLRERRRSVLVWCDGGGVVGCLLVP